MSGGLSVPKRLPLTGISGTPLFFENQTTQSESTTNTIIDTTSGTEDRKLWQLDFICRARGSYVLTLGGTVIASGRTSPAVPNLTFVWITGRPWPPSTQLKIDFTTQSGIPNNQDVEAYLQATEG